jgi:GNAT superfamily N-acetyltransferase
MTRADIDAGLRLCRASGWDQVARDWEHFISAASTHTTAAVRDGQVLGTAAAIHYGNRFGWIGMVLVDPTAQGQGLGASLLKSALDALGDVPVRLDATPAGYPLYMKQGFKEESRLRRMERMSTPVHLAAWDVGDRVKPMTLGDLPEIAASDAAVFGAPRRELLEWMFEGAPEYAFVTRTDRRLNGYLFGRHGFDFEHLGPIIASDPTAAMALTAVCMSRHADRPFIIDAACHDEHWLDFLDQAGFREQRPFIRMHRGGCLPFDQPQRQYAVLGPEFG